MKYKRMVRVWNLHESMGPSGDSTRDPWIFSQTRFWLCYAAWYYPVMIHQLTMFYQGFCYKHKSCTEGYTWKIWRYLTPISVQIHMLHRNTSFYLPCSYGFFLLIWYTFNKLGMVHGRFWGAICYNFQIKIYNEIIWVSAWDFQQFGMCDQQRLRPACA